MNSALKATLAQVVMALVVMGVLVWLARTAPFFEDLEDPQGAMDQWGLLSAPVYPLLVVAATVLFLPGGILSLGGGFFFGLWWGTLLVLLGNLIGAAVAFLAGRHLGRRFVRDRILRDSRWSALDGAIAKRGARIVFFSQLNPLFPTSLFNYLYGVTNVRFWPTMMWVGLGRLPGIFLYCYLGTLGQLGVRILSGESEPGPLDFVLWGGGLALTVVVAVVLGNTATKVIGEARGGGESADAQKTYSTNN